MHRTRFVAGASTAAAAIASLALVVGPASAAGAQYIHEGDLGPYSDSGGDGSFTFQGVDGSGGVLIDVPDNQDSYARFRFPVGVNLADVHNVVFGYSAGTADATPGIYYDVDADGDGTVDCELIGELTYGGQDVWLNRDAGQSQSITGSSDLDANDCASGGPVDDYGPGSGAVQHGSLDDWAAALAKSFAGTPVVTYGGALASGLVTNGTLSSISFGGSTFGLSQTTPANRTPPITGGQTGNTVADVTGSFASKQRAHKVVLTLTADRTPAGSTAGKALVWTYTVKGKTYTVTQAAGQSDKVTVTNYRHAKKAGNHKVVKLYQNGIKVGVFSILPRPRQH